MIASHVMGFRLGARIVRKMETSVAQKVGNAAGTAKAMCDIAWDDEGALSVIHRIEDMREAGTSYTDALRSVATGMVSAVVPDEAHRFEMRDDDVSQPNSLTLPPMAGDDVD